VGCFYFLNWLWLHLLQFHESSSSLRIWPSWIWQWYWSFQLVWILSVRSAGA
jgi:hypothetical protein